MSRKTRNSSKAATANKKVGFTYAARNKLNPLSCIGHVKRGEDGKRPLVPGLYSDTVFHGDNSGSMASMGRAPEDGGREFAKQYRDFSNANNDSETHLTFGVFSTDYVKVFSGDPGEMTEQDVDQCARAMRPTNSTCFYDTAVGQLKAQAVRVRQKYDELPRHIKRLVPKREFASVVFATLTDGQDNMSTLCGEEDLKVAFSEHKEEFGATILFLAANMNAQEVGSRYGLDYNNCLQMGSDQTYSAGAFKAVTQVALREASSGRQCSSLEPPPPPMFTTCLRQQSCSQAEATSYGAQIPGMSGNVPRSATAPTNNGRIPLLRQVPPPPPVPRLFNRQGAPGPPHATNPTGFLRQAATNGLSSPDDVLSVPPPLSLRVNGVPSYLAPRRVQDLRGSDVNLPDTYEVNNLPPKSTPRRSARLRTKAVAKRTKAPKINRTRPTFFSPPPAVRRSARYGNHVPLPLSDDDLSDDEEYKSQSSKN